MSTAPLHLRSLDNFVIRERTNGRVLKAIDKATGALVVLKVLTGKSYESKIARALKEGVILRKLQHNNIIKLTDKFTSNDDVYMVYEYMDHDLKGLLENERPTLQELKSYIKQMLTGLDYCHRKKVLHLALKCSNLVINGNGTLKLAEFGMAKDISENENRDLNRNVPSLWYRPPELLLGSTHYGTAVDMWSVGCVIAEIFLGKPILQGKSKKDQLNKIFQLCGSPNETNWPGQLESSQPCRRNMKEAFEDLHEGVLDLLEHLLVLDPSQRWSAKDCLSAKYFCEQSLPESLFRYDLQTEMPQQEEMEIEALLQEAIEKREEIQRQAPVPQPRLQASQSRHPQAHRHQSAGRRAARHSSHDSTLPRQSPYQRGTGVFHPPYSQGTSVLYGSQSAHMTQQQSASQQFPESKHHGLEQTCAGSQIENIPARLPFYGPVTGAHGDVYGQGSGCWEASEGSRYEWGNATSLQTEPLYTIRTGPGLGRFQGEYHGMREGPSLRQFQGEPHHGMITVPSPRHFQGYSYHGMSATPSFGCEIMAAGPNLRQGVGAYPTSLGFRQQQHGGQPPLLPDQYGMSQDLTACAGQPWCNASQIQSVLHPGSAFTGQPLQYVEAENLQQYGRQHPLFPDRFGMTEDLTAYTGQPWWNASQQHSFLQPGNAFISQLPQVGCAFELLKLLHFSAVLKHKQVFKFFSRGPLAASSEGSCVEYDIVKCRIGSLTNLWPCVQYNEAGNMSFGSARQQYRRVWEPLDLFEAPNAYSGRLPLLPDQYGTSQVLTAHNEQPWGDAAQQSMFQPSNAFTGHSLQSVEAETSHNARPSQNNAMPVNSLAARPQSNAFFPSARPQNNAFFPSARQSQTNIDTGPDSARQSYTRL